MITDSQWAAFENALNSNAQASFHLQDVTWKRFNNNISRNGEDGVETYTNITIPANVQSNYFRSWPIVSEQPTGVDDTQNIVIWINKKWLNDNGYITGDDYFDFDPDRDFFVYEGKTYKSKGDTGASYAKSGKVYFMLILQREEYETGQQPPKSG